MEHKRVCGGQGAASCHSMCPAKPFPAFFSLSWGSIVSCKQENGADRNVLHVLGERRGNVAVGFLEIPRIPKSQASRALGIAASMKEINYPMQLCWIWICGKWGIYEKGKGRVKV